MILFAEGGADTLESDDPKALWRAYLTGLERARDGRRYRQRNVDLLWCLSELATHPSVKERIMREIEAAAVQRLADEQRSDV